MRNVVVFLVFIISVCSGQLALSFVKNAQSRGAVCNDGSPAGFYFKPGTGSGANVWLIHQEGGYCCYNEEMCLARAQATPVLTSSKTWPDSVDMKEGIFADEQEFSPTFYNANKVYIGYCSSDYWAGTRAANGTSGLDTWNFMGHNITQAVIEDLVSDFGMNSTNSEILFTGCSAGGKGVFVNSDWARSFIPFTPAKYLAFSDEGWSADLPLTTSAYWYQFVAGEDLWKPLHNPNCDAAYPLHGFLCYFGSISLPYFETTTLIHVEQYDIVQMAEDCSCTFNPNNATMMGWMDELRTAFRSSFLTMKPPHSLFSPACATHCISLSSSFHTVSINGITLAQYLDKFWNSNGNVPNVVDNCSSFNCTVGCP
eukprot:Phypoly_transcript_11020.p1 GENE.Phypoly_transcript_11020~~Phypoly_transcript_11020.p1  ORF type:complete len:385 (+),score=54.55 Phypoly_transcript_11020:49-1155(+)